MGGGGSQAKEFPLEYLSASALAAAINYPLWRASAIGQSGFRVTASTTASNMMSSIAGLSIPSSISPYLYAFAPPYKGMIPTVLGMTWARAAIFWGSDRGKEILKRWNASEAVSTVLPPLVVSTIVQCINMPIVRASITLQNPQSDLPNTLASIRHIHRHHGWRGLWHGTSAGILKTVPKYCTAVAMKEYMESVLPTADPSSPSYESDRLGRSALKSAAAGVAGAALTNPLDVIRNEMFKTNKSFVETVRILHAELGYSFLTRGMGKNLVAVAIPVGCTIFFTDAFIQFTTSHRRRRQKQHQHHQNQHHQNQHHQNQNQHQQHHHHQPVRHHTTSVATNTAIATTTAATATATTTTTTTTVNGTPPTPPALTRPQ